MDKDSLGGDLVSVHFSRVNAVFGECKEKSGRWKRVQEAARCHFCMDHRLIQNVLVIKVSVKHNM